MSEQDEQRPLTRRERRLREMAETGALDLSEATEPPVDPDPESRPVEGEIEISPVNEDGTPRSRREMRQLREQALAERAAQAGPPTEPEPHTEVEREAEVETPAEAEVEAETPAEAEAEVEAETPAEAEAEAESPVEVEVEVETPAEAEAQAEAEVPTEPEPEVEVPAEAEAPDEAEHDAPTDGAAEPELDFDSLITPPTEPFSVEELREAEQPSAEAQSSGADAELDADESEETSSKPKRRFWQRNKGAAPAESAPAGVSPAAEQQLDPSAEAGPTPSPEVNDGVHDDADEPATAVVDPAVSDEDQVDDAQPPATAVLSEVSEAAQSPEPSAQSPEPSAQSPDQKTSYSFPDIAPPEEWRSVFDDPSARIVPDQGAGNANANGDGDFDDLISRAVAQEGSTGSTGGAALILPSMPEDTGGLTGPLGGTGDLYVTGSLKLPKSLGETGGHAAMHDSIEVDPITGAEPDEAQTTGQGPAPVSARHAVSARAASGMPVVAKPAKERSKLPLVLSLTGGGLLIAVIALGAWGASNGLFG
ncbi:hypothetical protein [Leucobacter triazinivorans]|uniref:Uncharacterized protein n=1 Tax=Leucobacter triazinivorans TaxID=1784719 RepID=A0A4P6KI24_9MICO|nr:hypothetical protein [Leucobacter triazinivorans]QBE49973.1 hypothetical protein EVS81_14995 [Leucobacter triazinivorans]